jgi:hypothetical protein
MWKSRAVFGRDFSKPRRESTLWVDFLEGVIFHRPPWIPPFLVAFSFPTPPPGRTPQPASGIPTIDAVSRDCKSENTPTSSPWLPGPWRNPSSTPLRTSPSATAVPQRCCPAPNNARGQVYLFFNWRPCGPPFHFVYVISKRSDQQMKIK